MLRRLRTRGLSLSAAQPLSLSALLLITWFSGTEALLAKGVAEGGQVSMDWNHVTCTLKTKKGLRHLLDNVHGQAKPGRLLAIMGPSGSGKTTMLNALAGQIVQSKGLSLEGSVLINGKNAGQDLEKVKRAYVRQEDIFYSQMTVRETLRFAARLRLPKKMKLKEKDEVVEEILQKLSLTKCAETVVGGEKVRGVSGGERKRLSIACELIASPSLIFLDEPTTGLDSFQAEKVVSSLQSLAKEGCTIVCVIHQPSGTVFNMFDDLLLLSEGQLVYQGEAKTVASYFNRLGYPCPSGINAGEFCLSLVSVNQESKETENACRERIRNLVHEANKNVPQKPTKGSLPKHERYKADDGSNRPQASILEQSKLLFARSWREVTRNKVANIIKLVQQVSTALIYGGIYSLTDSQKSIQDRLGLISLMAIGNTNLALAGTVRAFPKEKSIVMREKAGHLYGALPYFFSKVLAEAPVSAALSTVFGCILYPMVGFQKDVGKFTKFLAINVVHSFASSGLGLLLGACAPNSDAALALLPPVIVLMIIFNGFNIAEENTPRALWLLPRVSVVRWGFEGLSVNEFTDLNLKCDLRRKEMCAQSGEEALSRISTAFEKSSVRKAILAELAILGASYLQTYNVLRGSGPKYAQMEPPVADLPEHDPEHEAKAYVKDH